MLVNRNTFDAAIAGSRWRLRASVNAKTAADRAAWRLAEQQLIGGIRSQLSSALRIAFGELLEAEARGLRAELAIERGKLGARGGHGLHHGLLALAFEREDARADSPNLGGVWRLRVARRAERLQSLELRANARRKPIGDLVLDADEFLARAGQRGRKGLSTRAVVPVEHLLHGDAPPRGQKHVQ